MLTERVDQRGVGVGHEQHVGFLDLLEPADRRAVEAEALLEHFLRQLVRRDGEVLHQAGKVTEPHVDDLDAAVVHHLQDIAGCRHCVNLHLVTSGRTRRGIAEPRSRPLVRSQPAPATAPRSQGAISRPLPERERSVNGPVRPDSTSGTADHTCQNGERRQTIAAGFSERTAAGRVSRIAESERKIWNGNWTTCSEQSKSGACGSSACGSPTCSASSRASRSRPPSWRPRSKRA